MQTVKITIRITSVFSLMLAMLVSSSSWAMAADTSFSVPLPLFPGAAEVQRTAPDNTYYRLALGSQKKINNRWQAEKLRAHMGLVQSLTLELPTGFLLGDGIEFYQQQLQLAGLELLYQCDGRGCGSSNSWANNHFKIKQLYGLDQSQKYRVYLDSGIEGQQRYVILYAVQRGNKRIYFHLEQLLVTN